MLSHSPYSILQRIFISQLLLAFGVKRTACSLGDGKSIWRQPRSEHFLQDQSSLHDTFPSGFLWSSGTSAFQTEGAWDEGGKGVSIWDHFTQSSSCCDPSSENANVASDSYKLWEEDVKALKYLGVKAYSFSLSWPRLFPDGNAKGRPNAGVVEHYVRFIDGLLRNKIEPVVTIHHWDLPQVLQEAFGGWTNETLVGMFHDYATFCFQTFGSRVRYWITMHNPYLVSVQGYGTGLHAPGEPLGPSGSLIVAHNLIKAHAKVWHTYNIHFRPSQKGMVSIVLGSHWVEPQKGQATAANVDLCQQSMEAVLGWFANPIFGDGTYPPSLKIKYGDLLPEFSTQEKVWVRKTADFFALSFGPNNLRLGRNLVHYGQTVTPDLRRILSWINLEYGGVSVLVAEGGWFSEASVGKEDTVAIYLMKGFINQVLQAIKFDGLRVLGFSAWSLVDGFEWNYGYTIRRGLFYIDFSQPNRTRTPKTTAQYYKQVIANNGLPRDDAATDGKGRFPCGFHWGVADSALQVNFHPFSPQFTDPQVYTWNVTGDGALHPVRGQKLRTHRAQCTDYLAIRSHLSLLASTGASHYRFALNWSLILPHGTLSRVNTEALRYYRCVLSELRKLGLEAVVILYYPTHRSSHLGLPGPLHASGGWLNGSTVEAFQEYASLCYRELGSSVRYWITVNEPNRLSDFYASGEEKHLAAHNLLLAHAKAWRLHERRYSNQRAMVSLALHADWAKPANPFLDSHKAAAQRFLLFELGRFLDPLLGTRYQKKRSDYPREMKAYLEERARGMGRHGSPLPAFTDTERRELRGALSFIALNHFTTRLVSPYPTAQNHSEEKQYVSHDCLVLSDPTWPSSKMGQALVPWGLRRILNWVTDRYGTLPIIITASGVDDQAPVKDTLKQHFLRTYVQEALKAYHVDGVNLQGFYVWKLQDEHSPQFGLFASTHHQSRAKASVSAYKEIIAHGGFPEDNAVRACSPGEAPQSCSVCVWIVKNKALLVFGGCVLLIAGTFMGLVVYVVVAKRNQTRSRRSRVNRLSRRWRGAPVFSCPRFVKS